jgi:serine/threonine protein phosphatase 1
VFLGDYIDRGPATRQCIDLILAFEAERRVDVIGLLGNHDDWLLRTRRDFRNHTWLLATDPFGTIRSYSPHAADALLAAKVESRGAVYRNDYPLPYDLFFDAMPATHLDWFERLRVSHRTADCFCSHGGVDPKIADLAEQARHPLIWGGTGFPERYTGPDTVVYGHHNNAVLTADGWPMPAISERTIGIDTISHGVLTAVRLPGGDICQSARFARRKP